MLSIEYRLLCTILFRHAYYQDKRSSDFSLSPTEACALAMEQNGLVMKRTKDRTLILQKMDDGIPEFKLEEPVCLNFLVYLENPLFWNVIGITSATDSGVPAISKFYLSNLDDDGQLSDKLTRKDILSPEDAMPSLENLVFNVNVAKGETSSFAITQLNAAKGWELWKTLVVNPDQEIVSVSLPRPGLYKFSKGLPGETPVKILANNDAVSSGPFFAVLDLYLDNNINAGTQMITYISNRLLPWQYVLIDIKDKKINYGNPEAISLKYMRHVNDKESPEAVLFSRVPDDELQGKIKEVVRQIRQNNIDSVDDVFVFKSDVAVPLMEHKPQTVTLEIEGLAESARLPIPDVSKINICDNHSLIYHNI